MKKKVLCIFVIMIMAITSISNIVFADEILTTQEKNTIAEQFFEDWIEAYKNEDVPENRRITDYSMGSIGMHDISENEFLATIEFTVTPVSIENTEWNYGEPETILWDGHPFIWYVKNNICYIKIKMENGEYQVEYIRETPEGYDEFTQRFEEYKKTHEQEEVSNTQIQGEETENQLANQEIEKMSNGIVIGCSIILVIIVSFSMIKIIKYSHKNNKK